MNNKQPYPSDLTDDEWERIRWLLPRSRRGRTPTHSRRIMLNAVLYVARTGCQWRMLPSDFPRWQSCYAYFRKWSESRDDQLSLLEQALKKCGWRGPARPWSERANDLRDC